MIYLRRRILHYSDWLALGANWAKEGKKMSCDLVAFKLSEVDNNSKYVYTIVDDTAMIYIYSSIQDSLPVNQLVDNEVKTSAARVK